MNRAAITNFEHVSGCTHSEVSLSCILEIYQMYISVGFTNQYSTFPDGSAGKNSACSAGDTGDISSITGLERSPGEENGNPLQYSCLKNSIDRGAWWAAVHGVTQSHTHTPLKRNTEERHIGRTGRRSCGDGGRDESDVGTSQGTREPPVTAEARKYSSLELLEGVCLC